MGYFSIACGILALGTILWFVHRAKPIRCTVTQINEHDIEIMQISKPRKVFKVAKPLRTLSLGQNVDYYRFPTMIRVIKKKKRRDKHNI